MEVCVECDFFFDEYAFSLYYFIISCIFVAVVCGAKVCSL